MEKNTTTQEPAKQEQGLSESEAETLIQTGVNKILSQQGEVKEWGIAEHLNLLFKVAQENGLPDEARKDFMLCLRQAGLGDNQSQFRQSKFLKGKLPEAKRSTMLKAYD